MNKKRRIILFSVIALFILGMAFYPRIKRWFVHTDGEPAKQETSSGNKSRQPLLVNAKILKNEVLTDVIKSTGNFLPDEEVDLSFETAGKITHIYFKEGSRIKKGELLAKVNDAPLQAELQKLQAQMPLAKERVVRQRALLEKDAVSQEAFEQVTTELDKLTADIDLVKSRIAQTELRAPFDGIIGLRRVSEGSYTSPTTVVAKLTKIIPLKIEFSIPEMYANIIHPGTPLTFNSTNPNNPDIRKASVYAVEPTMDLATRSVKVRATYPNTDGSLKPGGTVYVEIESNQIENALVVPTEAVIAEMGRDIAYLYQDGTAKQVSVLKGMRTAGGLQILEGLHVGDTLLTTGIMQLRDGLPVTIGNLIQ